MKAKGKINDFVVVGALGGFLGAIPMDLLNLLSWRLGIASNTIASFNTSGKSQRYINMICQEFSKPTFFSLTVFSRDTLYDIVPRQGVLRPGCFNFPGSEILQKHQMRLMWYLKIERGCF